MRTTLRTTTRPSLTFTILFATASAFADPTEEITRLAKTMNYSVADADLKTEMGRRVHMDTFKSLADASAYLEAMLTKDPEHWGAVRTGLQHLPRDPKRRDEKMRKLRLLAGDRHESTRNLLVKELKGDPEAFDADLLVRVDTLRIDGARASLRRLMQGKPTQTKVRAAIHLGLRADRAAKPVLIWALSQPALHKFFNSTQYGVAIALKRVGKEGAWTTVRKNAVEKARAYLGRNDLKGARWHVAQLEYYAKLARGKAQPSVFELDRGAASFALNRIRVLETKESIRAAIKNLSA